MAEVRELIPEMLHKFDFIQTLEIIDNKVLVTLDDPETRNPQIIRELVQHGLDIQFVGEIRHSLENVYLKLVQEG